MNDDDTAIGGPDGRFPATRRSAVVAAQSGDPDERSRALGTLVELYWKPVYKHLRLSWKLGNEDAKDLTQDFFARAIEKGFFAGYDGAKGTFRTFLRTCLDRHVTNERKAAGRQKRGGDVAVVDLDFVGAEGEIRELEVAGGESPEECFDREWIRSFFGLAVEALRVDLAAEGKEVYFALFERYDLDPPEGVRPTYQALAAELGLKATAVTNYLASARRRFRRIVLERLREVTANDAEFRREARALLGEAVL